ncbi:MAG: universal stress protein [Mesorhizobium sp.]|uniref:universal stress protein n=1 Tax=Mesorhizobium sp. TaxID=1871066 RepID=UPI000FE54B7F|nr:universal stress protein [Mesorhizobium sp.]RWM04394.1 MAG: universal stress protein [Mesorhizobium sp.]TIO50155.1 MAG: universal stress protein [Mesorhizobium sp.]TIO57293.1 MAG: universal stress protein [Mesorhizobium sp.]TJV61797.1 MAG: universal stress protein [Mesorhizobium sp.]
MLIGTGLEGDRFSIFSWRRSKSAGAGNEVCRGSGASHGARLSILTVGEALSEDVKQYARAEGSVADALEGFSDRLLQQARIAAEKVGVSAIHTQSGWGDPAEVIIEMARRKKVDTIVVGRRGHGRLTGLLLGSVSQKLVSLALAWWPLFRDLFMNSRGSSRQWARALASRSGGLFH